MLKLEKLELFNWCKFQGSKSILFEDGFNVINGRNGKGKTSILHAISILLLNRYDGSFVDYINNKCDEASAELTFKIGNDTYVSELKLKKAKSTSTERHLKKNGEVIASGEDCAKKLDEILPSFLTSYSLFYRQESDDKVTDCSDSDRRNLLTQLVSIDYSDKVAQYITPNIENLKNQVSEIEKNIYALENKNYILGEEKVVGEKHPQSVIDGLKATVALWEENVKKTQQKEKLEKDIQVATQDLEDTKQRYDVDRITKQKEENIANLKSATEQQLAEIATKKASAKNESKAKMQQLLESTDKAKSELESLKFQDVDDFDYSAVSTISSNIASLTTTKNITLKNIKSLESGVCPTCGSNCTHKLQDFQKELSDTDAQIKTLEQDLQKTLEQQKVFEEAKKFNENALNRKSKLENEISNTDVNIEAEKKNILTLLQSLKEKETLLNEKLTSDIQNAETSAQTQIEASKELIAQKKKYVEDLNSQLGEIKIVDVADCREELDRCEKENAEIDNIISYNKAIREQNEAVKLQQVQDKAEKENLEKKLIDVKKLLANYTTSSELLSRTYPTWKLERDLKSIENKTNLFVEDIYEPLYIKFVANKNSLKMSYGEGGRDIPVRKLSGAEKQIVNLAVENTFNQQQNLSCLILDECDSAMDKENKDAFFNTLLSLPDYYNQILVITHDEKVKDVLQAEGANIVMIN